MGGSDSLRPNEEDGIPVPKLRFRADGTFTIAQFTDLHWHNGEELDRMTLQVMCKVLEAEQPDLVVLTGDNLGGKGCTDPERSVSQLVGPLETSGVPWAVVFGNHDDEGSVSRAGLMELYRSYKGCLAEPGPPDLPGVGNYVLTVAADRGTVPTILYFLDSNSYAPEEIGGYGWVHHDQVAWYRRTARALANAHAPGLPALAFFHIPLPEYDSVWQHATCYGRKEESVCCPRLNSGLFAAMVEQGDVMATFVGHDHVNDYVGEWMGIHLAYGKVTGYQTYPRDGSPRGARIIRLTAGRRHFSTWLRLDDGSRSDDLTCL